MKQFFILLMTFVATDSFASGIASNSASAPCTNNTLETYSGNSNLSADWQPNEIQLRWYKNNTLMDVQSSANTCTYDGTLTIPSTAPTRTGYTFAGWQVRPEMDFSSLNLPTCTERFGKNATSTCIYGINGDNARAIKCDDDVRFKELSENEWMALYDDNGKMLYGMAKCSVTNGTRYQPGTPSDTDGQYCWCKVTGYRQTNQAQINAPSKNLPWVFATDDYTISTCGSICVERCAYRAGHTTYFRNSLFGIPQ